MTNESGNYAAMERAIIDQNILHAAVDSVERLVNLHSQDKNASGDFPLDDEPVLKDYLRDEVLKLVGKIGLIDNRNRLMGLVSSEIHYMLNIAIEATRSGYRHLFQDFLPDDDLRVSGSRHGETPGNETIINP